MTTAIYPGSFDPVTLGHIDIIERAAKCFDRLYVCVMVNADKKSPMFTPEERMEFVKTAVEHLDNVQAEAWSGLLTDYAQQKNATVLVKGARNVCDFDMEYQMSLINRGIKPDLETVILPASAEYIHFSSSMAREMIRYRQPLEKYLPGKDRAGGGSNCRRKTYQEVKSMENDVQQLIDLLYDMIDNAKGVPLGNDKCVIERNRALDYLDEIRAQMPAELEEAKKLVAARAEYVANAKKEAENMRQRAQNDAKHIVSESETLHTARQQANEIVHKAEERTREMYRVANEYTEDALKRTEDALQAALEEVRLSHRQYTELSRSRMQEALRGKPAQSETPEE